MPRSTPAGRLLWPTDSRLLLRAVFLYVGQGQSTLLFAAADKGYCGILIDTNLDKECGGINVPALVTDLFGETGLEVFVNTHHHDDHLRGLSELAAGVRVSQVWHSGHNPGKMEGDYFQDLVSLMEKVKEQGGRILELRGSREPQRIGEVTYYVLAPADYVKEEIADEKSEARYRRIHEQCAVLKFGAQNAWMLVPGDADRDAFQKHITAYHSDRLVAQVLAASHHGSRDFFRENEEQEPYMDALNAIAPRAIIVSAPKQDESKHGHPHSDALEQYAKKVGSSNVLHLGKGRCSYWWDIYRDGTYSSTLVSDSGQLAKDYPIPNRDGGGKGKYVKPTGVERLSGSHYA